MRLSLYQENIDADLVVFFFLGTARQYEINPRMEENRLFFFLNLRVIWWSRSVRFDAFFLFRWRSFETHSLLLFAYKNLTP